MHPIALLFLTIEERERLARVEERDEEHRLVMARAKREARERALAQRPAASPGRLRTLLRRTLLRRLPAA